MWYWRYRILMWRKDQLERMAIEANREGMRHRALWLKQRSEDLRQKALRVSARGVARAIKRS